MNCFCNLKANYFTVKKEGPNTGRKFYTCSNKEASCGFFKWDDAIGNYNPENFKDGSCYRCGRWGCEITDCEKTTDFFGNVIPENYAKYFV
jgi:hypothetical protein